MTIVKNKLTKAAAIAVGAMSVFVLYINTQPSAQAHPQIINVVAQPKPQVLVHNDVNVTPSPYHEQQVRCLAQNAYFEAGNQSRKGMIAVTNVVMNRVKDKRFPNSPCAVINQKTKGVCQFSWVCEGKKRIKDKSLYDKTFEVAKQVYYKHVGDVTYGAKFYHADYVRPSWGRVFKRTVVIGDHIFYRG